METTTTTILTIPELQAQIAAKAERRIALAREVTESRHNETECRAAVVAGEEGATKRLSDASITTNALQSALTELNEQIAADQSTLADAQAKDVRAGKLVQLQELADAATEEKAEIERLWREADAVLLEKLGALLDARGRLTAHRRQFSQVCEELGSRVASGYGMRTVAPHDLPRTVDVEEVTAEYDNEPQTTLTYGISQAVKNLANIRERERGNTGGSFNG